tara:strand:+ start:77 stop:772 length:696 start_codon:yes stop_codon:yes gene_type:complete
MAKTKNLKIPKYLKLNKGMMWMDTEGKNPSGVRLFATDEHFIGRGYHTDDEFAASKEKDEPVPTPTKPVPKEYVSETPNDERITAYSGQYGYQVGSDKSWFDTSEIPKDKMVNIITAFNNNVLVEFDPEKEKKPKQIPDRQKNFAHNDKGDLIFVGQNKNAYQRLQHNDSNNILKFIRGCTKTSSNTLRDMYDYELKGYNNLSRGRHEVLDAIRKKLNEIGGGMSPITVND